MRDFGMILPAQIDPVVRSVSSCTLANPPCNKIRNKHVKNVRKKSKFKNNADQYVLHLPKPTACIKDELLILYDFRRAGCIVYEAAREIVYTNVKNRQNNPKFKQKVEQHVVHLSKQTACLNDELLIFYNFGRKMNFPRHFTFHLDTPDFLFFDPSG